MGPSQTPKTEKKKHSNNKSKATDALRKQQDVEAIKSSGLGLLKSVHSYRRSPQGISSFSFGLGRS